MLKLSFCPSFRFRAGSRCHRYFFRPSDHLSIRPAVSPFTSDRQSVRPAHRQSVRSPSVRQSVSPSAVRPSTVSPSVIRQSVRQPSVRPSTVRPSTVRPSVNCRPSVNRFLLGKKRKKNHTRNPNWELATFKINKKVLYFMPGPEGVQTFQK